MARKRFSGSIGNAFTTVVHDLLTQKDSVQPVPKSVRLEGKTCFITGASSGLGKAVSLEMARRGARLILACRTGIPAIVDEIKEGTSNDHVEAIHVDLSDLDSVRQLCDTLRDNQLHLDISILNAGLSAVTSRHSAQGYELMFAVHFLANRYLMNRFLEDGVIKPATKASASQVPRVIIVSSEAHRAATSYDFNELGQFVEFGQRDALRHYGISKMILCGYACELSRRLNTSDSVSVSVHSLCPGPVATKIAREAPKALKPIINPLLKVLFKSPKKAIEPIISLACAPEIEHRTAMYLHMMQEKSVSPHASDITNGQLLWDLSEDMLSKYEAGNSLLD